MQSAENGEGSRSSIVCSRFISFTQPRCTVRFITSHSVCLRGVHNIRIYILAGESICGCIDKHAWVGIWKIRYACIQAYNQMTPRSVRADHFTCSYGCAGVATRTRPLEECYPHMAVSERYLIWYSPYYAVSPSILSVFQVEVL